MVIHARPQPGLFRTQAAVAVPDEGGTITVHSATQSLDAVQQAVAATLSVAQHQARGTGWGNDVCEVTCEARCPGVFVCLSLVLRAGPMARASRHVCC